MMEANSELNQLKAKVRQLADEKTYLQLVIDLIESLNTLVGMNNITRCLLKNIMASVGGTDIKLYYWIDKELHYTDSGNENKIITLIDDPLVNKVIETGKFFQQETHTLATKPYDEHHKFCNMCTWVFPLTVGHQLIAVIKIENLALDKLPLQNYLPIAFTHAALLLNNEIRHYKQQQIEENLRISEQKLLTILDNVDACIYLKDIEGQYLFANQQGCNLLKIERSEVIGFSDDKFFDAATVDTIKRNDHLVLIQGEVLKTIEVNTIPSINKTIYYQSTKLPLCREDGSIYGLCGISVDITERAEIEAQLRYERDRAQQYLDTVETLIVALDTKGHITLINRKGCQILGYQETELLGQCWFDKCLPQPDSMENIYPVFLKIISGDLTDIEYFENTIITRTGELREIAWHNGLLHDEQGQIIGLLSSGEDITERKQTELELQQYREHLEKLVEERTSALLIAKEAAETANMAKSKFIATMSHELRTPLNAILGFSELISLDKQITEAQKNSLDIINRSGTHLLNMINDVLDISKIEAGKLELSIQGCDLLYLLQDIGNMIHVKAMKNHLSFNLEIADNIERYIVVDIGKLRQILINLLSNAIKFTKQGSVILRAMSQPIDAANTLVSIEVIDTGIGIAENQQQQLFKPFVQLAQDNSDIKGTGLGLTISKSLIELMGGRICFDSTLGVGSNFKIQLPAAIADANEIVIEEKLAPVKSIAPEQPAWRLLVVDDNLDNRLLLVSLLTRVGFEVHEAENGQEAIAEFKQWQPHLIWMDMRMPVVDGYEATKIIRQLPQGKDVKIVAITASAFKEQHQIILNSGCDAIIHKPFKSSEIFTTLTTVLGVKFIYQNEFNADIQTSIKEQSILVRKLPFTLKQQLQEAVLSLDMEEIDKIIDEIYQIMPELAKCLGDLATHYQFEQLLHLIESEYDSFN